MVAVYTARPSAADSAAEGTGIYSGALSGEALSGFAARERPPSAVAEGVVEPDRQ